jgi:geranylgeranyl diphosphate synthase, type II
MTNVSELQQLIESEISHYSALWDQSHPVNLYKPICYALKVGGKRIRPLMVLLSYQLFKDDPEEILKAAIAIELFHNFTLLHDDIMDKAEMRRNQPSVHIRFNENTAILSGDVMAFLAYGLLFEIKSERKADIISQFTYTAREVCEGQQLDMDFESRSDVTSGEYIGMIRLKTAVLLGCSLKVGGWLGGCDEDVAQSLYDAGICMGLAFQLKDDLLDTFGEEKAFGKIIGGDIISNKKTFLLTEALQRADYQQKKLMGNWLSKEIFNKEEKIHTIKAIYKELDIQTITVNKINEFTSRGIEILESLPVAADRKEPLMELVRNLISRNN